MDQLLEEIGLLDDISDLLKRFITVTSPPDSPSPRASPGFDSPPPGQTLGDMWDAIGRDDSAESVAYGGHLDLSRSDYDGNESESSDGDSPAPPRRRRVRFMDGGSELVFKRKPRLDHMRVFGTECYAHAPKQKPKKLDDTGVKCVFFGYTKQRKAYRLQNIGDGSIVILKSVTFAEAFVLKVPMYATEGLFDVIDDDKD